MPCFYTPELYSKMEKIEISGTEFHHLAHVLRKKPGNEILLTNGKGLLATAKIDKIEKNIIKALIENVLPQKFGSPKLAVAFSLLKNKHDNLIVEKLTELGVKAFFPIQTERTMRKPNKNTLQKFTKVAISAIKQCDNAFLPEIAKVQKLPDLLDNLKSYQALVGLETKAQQNLRDRLKQNPAEKFCLIIGPEGGFTSQEIDLFAEKEIPTFSLGNHIVRAETAAIATVSQFLAFQLEKNKFYY